MATATAAGGAFSYASMFQAVPPPPPPPPSTNMTMFQGNTSSKMTDDDVKPLPVKPIVTGVNGSASYPASSTPSPDKLKYSSRIAVANTDILTRDCPHEFYIGTFDFMRIKLHWIVYDHDCRGYQSLLYLSSGSRLNDMTMSHDYGRMDLSIFNSTPSVLERIALGATAGAVQAIYDYTLKGTATRVETYQTVHETSQLDTKDSNVIVVGKRVRDIPYYRFVVRGNGDPTQTPMTGLPPIQLSVSISSPMEFTNIIPYKKDQQISLIQLLRQNAGVIGGATAIGFNVLVAPTPVALGQPSSLKKKPKS